MTDRQLDKFYTKKDLAKELYNILLSEMNLTGEELFLEPSAGNGSFSSLCQNVEAYDIKPEGPNIIEADFLKLTLENKHFITIGNPPFGSRCSLAVEFFNKSAEVSDTIAMILPSTFMKWSIQSQLDKNFQLVYTKKLQEDAFTFQESDYSVRTYFMIWTKYPLPNQKNQRILSNPPISHPDFKIWQHNATAGSRKFVDEPWEIATWRQGYNNYNEIFTHDDYEKVKDMVYNTGKQFFFIKPLNEKAKKIISLMDFNELAKRNLSTPGFGKRDFVSYYTELLNNFNQKHL